MTRGAWPCSRDALQSSRVADIMTPAAALVTLSPEQDALQGLQTIERRDLSQLPVVRNRELLGLLRREDILKWLALHPHAGRTA
jgi:CBS domain-containing protein